MQFAFVPIEMRNRICSEGNKIQKYFAFVAEIEIKKNRLFVIKIE